MVRRAYLMASAEQYIRLAVSFGLVAVISRLLTPAEVGVSVIGVGIVALAMGLREFASAEYLIQRHDVSRDDVRTVFTVLLLLTTAIASAIFVLAPYFGSLYGEPRLALFLQVSAVAGVMEFLAGPTIALLRREMAFGTLASINVASVIVNAVTAIGLALAGFSYMSIAWASVAGSATMIVLCFSFRPEFWMLKPRFRSWRGVLGFGGYAGLTYMINRAYESLPQLVLGQILHTSAVGIYNRSSVVASLPDRVVLTGVVQVAFPALAAQVRAGHNVKESYLGALGLITVAYWPAQLVMALLAYPVIMLVLGNQWESAVPVLRIMLIAGIAWFPVVLTTPVLLSIGENRDRLLVELVSRPLSAAVLCAAAYFGVMAMAASQFLTLPFQMIVAFLFVRRHVPFMWGELGGAIYKSAAVSTLTIIGPLAVIAFNGTLELSFDAALIAGILAIPGWLAGVIITHHPVRAELEKLLDAAVSSSMGRRWALSLQRERG